eukprot:scaffold3348_cov74-Cylindrotheca_fusiformis.AAC.5
METRIVLQFWCRIYISNFLRLDSQLTVFLRKGDCSEPLEGRSDFAPAVFGLTCLVEEFRKFVCNTDDDKYHFNSGEMTSLDECMISSKTKSISHTSEDGPETPYVYKTAIQLPARLVQRRDRNNIISSVLLFNLALAHQLDASESEDSSPEMYTLRLYKAMHLFKLGYRIQERKGYLNGNMLFALATLNNLGVVHNYLNLPVVADLCFNKLLSILMLLTESKCFDTNQLELNGFFQNASTAIATYKSTAAAA